MSVECVYIHPYSVHLIGLIDFNTFNYVQGDWADVTSLSGHLLINKTKTK